MNFCAKPRKQEDVIREYMKNYMKYYAPNFSNDYLARDGIVTILIIVYSIKNLSINYISNQFLIQI